MVPSVVDQFVHKLLDPLADRTHRELDTSSDALAAVVEAAGPRSTADVIPTPGAEASPTPAWTTDTRNVPSTRAGPIETPNRITTTILTRSVIMPCYTVTESQLT